MNVFEYFGKPSAVAFSTFVSPHQQGDGKQMMPPTTLLPIGQHFLLGSAIQSSDLSFLWLSDTIFYET